MTEARPTEVHIASFIVHCHESALQALDHHLTTLEGVEVQPADPAGAGRRIVICEGPNQGHILDRMETIEGLPGVLGCSLVYHEVMTDQEADQQMITEVKSA